MDSASVEVASGAHLDTVRALHQTVVSLRTALEVSKNELKELKQKYEQHSHCLEYTDIIEKLSLENHILRRRIIDSSVEEQKAPNIKLQVTYSPRQNVEDFDSEVVIHTATTEAKSTVESLTEKGSEFCSTEKLNEVEEKQDFTDFDISAEVSAAIETFESSNRDSEEIVETSNKGEAFGLEESSREQLEILQESFREEITENGKESVELSLEEEAEEEHKEEPQSQLTSYARFDSEDIQPSSFRTKLELLSKFDVRIKVRTLKEGIITSSTTSDSDSTVDDKKEFPQKDKFHKEKQTSDSNFHFVENREHFATNEDERGNTIRLKAVSSENIKMAVPNDGDGKKVDKFDVQVKITSEENLVVKERVERNRRKDTLNLDVDNLSLRSMSEGDNSVFSEGVATPIGPGAGSVGGDRDAHSDNESEEVDDIELIFTTDESKDMSNLQEDLVSIREAGDTTESYQWHPSSASSHSTPVLIKFHTLDPDFQPGMETSDNAENENQENNSLQGVIAESSLRMKRVSLPNDKEIRHVAFNGRSLDIPGRGILKSCDNKSDNMLYKRSPNSSTRRLDSVDSLTCEYNRGLSFDNTKSSSFELGSSMDILHREESMDSFHKTALLGHRFSLFAETDISKCGISEEDLVGNLNLRRNTCPNPFQFRPSRYVSRLPGPFKAGAGAGAGARARPVLREGAGAAGRRESGAQTDVSALPARSTSDGYLAYKSSAPSLCVPTLPTRSAPRRLPIAVADARPAAAAALRRTDETRRVLLSDIGFTSMVPELSRSADPLCALGKRPAPPPPPPAAHQDAPPTAPAKFLSRGSYRSPCLSVDQSTDWVPQNIYVPKTSASWRNSLPDVRARLDRDRDTDLLLAEADSFLRRSIDNLHCTALDLDRGSGNGNGSGSGLVQTGQPYIPAEPKQLRLGHVVKVITPNGRVAVGRVRYVGLAGGTSATAGIMVGAEFPLALNPNLPLNDGTLRTRRYFLTTSQHTALFVPFSKVVMAWAN